MGLCLGSPRHHTEEPGHSVSGSSSYRPCNTEDPNSQNLKVYSLRELKAATKNFKPDMVLREGGFGEVYKGWIGDNAVAIKKLNSLTARSFLEWKVFAYELLGRSVASEPGEGIGYCMEENKLLLVSEFMRQGNLEDHLFTRNSKEALSWDQRLKIAIGAGRALSFLHTSEQPVTYRNFKACNILLDGECNAKISDFGLAKFGIAPSALHGQVTIMYGEYGHSTPEYNMTGCIQVQNSVYGFGVVLLEMLTGLRALDRTRPTEQISLVQWVKPYMSSARKFKQIIDATIVNQCSINAALHVAEVARECTASDPKSRPSMEHVVEALLQIYGYCRL